MRSQTLRRPCWGPAEYGIKRIVKSGAVSERNTPPQIFGGVKPACLSEQGPAEEDSCHHTVLASAKLQKNSACFHLLELLLVQPKCSKFHVFESIVKDGHLEVGDLEVLPLLEQLLPLGAAAARRTIQVRNLQLAAQSQQE